MIVRSRRGAAIERAARFETLRSRGTCGRSRRHRGSGHNHTWSPNAVGSRGVGGFRSIVRNRLIPPWIDAGSPMDRHGDGTRRGQPATR